MTKTGIFSFFTFLLIASTTQAAEVAEVTTVAPRSGLALIDWIIIAAYATGTIWLGYHFSRKQETTKEYFVGSGSMNPILIGVSLFATLLSTISYLSMPGEILGKGPVYFTSLVAIPFVFYTVSYLLLPVYMKQKVTSAYELLEAKLGLSIRLLGASMFIILRLVWMSLLIFMTSEAMVAMMGIDEKWIPLVALATGTVAVIYTSLGGLRAVVITDALQTILLYGGALTVIGVITYRMGGFGWFPTQWDPEWDHQPIFPESISTRFTVIGAIIGNFVWYVCTAGGDQTSVQRFMATKDVKAARQALATQLTVGTIVMLTLGMVGFALLGYFRAHPELLADGLTLEADADKILPNFIAFHLPPGISGIVVAAMFAAAMSSIDSGVNSITAVVMTDGLDRFGYKPATEEEHVRIARWMAFGIGLFVVICSSGMGSVPGNYTEMSGKTSNLLTTPIFGLFFFALFVPFATPKGVWIGTTFGVVTAALIAFSGPIFGFHIGADGKKLDPISFQWIAPTAITVNIITGCIASLIFPNPPDPTKTATE